MVIRILIIRIKYMISHKRDLINLDKLSSNTVYKITFLFLCSNIVNLKRLFCFQKAGKMFESLLVHKRGLYTGPLILRI